MTTSSHEPPAAIRALAEARTQARRAHEWTEADRLRAEIEAAGWKIVDTGFAFALAPTDAPTTTIDGVVRYGRSADVPSRLADPAVGVATVVLLATEWPADLRRALAGLHSHAPVGTQIVVVADEPSADQEADLATLADEVVRTGARLGHAAATNAGIRRARAPVVIVLDTSVEVTGDIVTPLARALKDPTVAVAGGWGIVSADLRHFEDAPAGDVDAIEGYCQAFRRDDYTARGPLDERFRFYRNLDIWWSLVLRDEGTDRPPRRAVSLDGLSLVRHEHRGYASVPVAERDRLSKRNFYRVLDRFGGRRDLLVAAALD